MSKKANNLKIQGDGEKQARAIHEDNLYHFLSALQSCQVEGIDVAPGAIARPNEWSLTLRVRIKPNLNPAYAEQYRAEMYILPAATLPDRRTRRTICRVNGDRAR